MIQLGVNSVLFQGHDLATAMQHIAWAGYDGIELSAIQGMCEHLDLDHWRDQVDSIRSMAAEHKLALLSTEVASLDETRLMKAFEAAAAIGIPVINCGPGGKMNVEEDFLKQTAHIAKMAEKAATFKVTLCVKAHVGASIFNTPTTLRAMKVIQAPAFGVDMDPSHIYRAGENPAEALPAVIQRVRHIHIRDCKGRGPSPGDPCNQACGRGDIDLAGYFKAMTQARYNGPVCLEVIGAGNYELPRRDVIAAESYGYMNACLKALGAR
ncbi:MAG: xylose isomerase [Lentisphaerae bacterium RIFOXYC12_FULL_60_16]|nr:MAG: xylose isomerase [Lentisphaerae bacterium RIFOXYC12_FULL_60_16]